MKLPRSILEVAKEHPNYPNYLFLPDGRIWSIKRNLFMRPSLSGPRRNYYNVSLGKIKNKKVHRLMLEVFAGPCPPDHEGAHLNGNTLDNRIENLKWVTHKENCDHQVDHGTRRVGSKHQNSKL